ncbi:hypothetical protein IAR50_003785 [Cryptococcus sp. DSM 104548]
MISVFTIGRFLSVIPLLAIASPVPTQRIVARHVIGGKVLAVRDPMEHVDLLSGTTVYLEDTDGGALVSSHNYTTFIVETHDGTSTLIAGWAAQPIYQAGAGHILGVPGYIYAPWSFPRVSPDNYPLQVCTFIYAEADDGGVNITLSLSDQRDGFHVDVVAAELGLGEAVTDTCVRVGSSSTTSSSVVTSSSQLSSQSAGSTSAPVVVSSSSSPVTIASTTATFKASTAVSPTDPSSSSSGKAISTVVAVPTGTLSSVSVGSSTASRSSDVKSWPAVSSISVSASSGSGVGPSASFSTNTTTISPASGSSFTTSTVVAVPTSSLPTVGVTSSAVARSSSIESSPVASSTSVSASIGSPGDGSFTSYLANTTATSTVSIFSSSSTLPITTAIPTNTTVPSDNATNATKTLSEPNSAYQTNVTFAGKTYINKGLVGFGALDGDAVDSFGETIGGIGSAIALQSFEKGSHGVYTGVMIVQPDRGHNTDTTTDYISRRHYISFTLNPYYNSTQLSYQSAKSTFELKYESTVRYYESDGTPTTGLDATAIRNGSVPEPIANATYNHISSDPEGLVLNADGSFWVSDEYGPYIWRYSADGILLETIVPPKAVLPYKNGSLFFSAETENPDTGRVPNQGFEGLTASSDGNTLYALLQTGTVQDLDADDYGRYTRLYVYDVSGTPTLTNAYVLTLPVTNGKGKPLAQSDFIWIADDTFILLSRDGKGNGDDDAESKHKDFMLFNLDGATDIAGTNYTDGVEPIAPGGVLVSDITPIVPTEFVDMIDDTQLERFGLHNDGDFDVSLINSKWESSALASVNDPAYPDDYFLFSFSDNDFITTNGSEAGEAYVDGYGSTLDNQALIWRVTLPN